MWLAAFKFLTGSIGGDLRKAYEAKLNATTNNDRIAADIQIVRLEERQKNRALGGRLTAWVQFAWAAPFMAYNAKLIVWDKMMSMGATDPLSLPLMDLQIRIVTFYFGGVAAIGVVKALRN